MQVGSTARMRTSGQLSTTMRKRSVDAITLTVDGKIPSHVAANGKHAKLRSTTCWRLVSIDPICKRRRLMLRRGDLRSSLHSR